MESLFLFCLFVIFYTYLGYGLLLFGIIKVKRFFYGLPVLPSGDKLPSLTVVVAAYNEESIISEKIKNTLSLSYPKDKVHYLFVTDGSNDSTPLLISQFPQVKLMHSKERNGKIAAVQRAMGEVNTEIVVFTDANTFLNKDALVKIARHYSNPRVGAVSGEKRVNIEEKGDATAGEGMYWKYESQLKKWDSELYSVVGAAGELFSIRTALYEPVSPNTILDDFMLSMLIAAQGYKIVYEPEAYAAENSSENIREEFKRKTRIAAGGLQSVIWLRELLFSLNYPLLSFQYVSHRVLRWTITPYLMILLYFVNSILAFKSSNIFFYQLFFFFQTLFYGLSYLGWYFENKSVKVKALFIPFYFCMMNAAILVGINNYLRGKQSSVWEKSARKK